MIVQVDSGPHFKHVKVIRCDIRLESVKKCRGAENEPISGVSLGPHFQTPPYFLQNEDSNF
jgi:hypothetical protein